MGSVAVTVYGRNSAESKYSQGKAFEVNEQGHLFVKDRDHNEDFTYIAAFRPDVWLFVEVDELASEVEPT
jgi:hypothetical protein